MNEKSVIITGAAGFAGYSTCLEFAEQGYSVWAVVRPGSAHNARLNDHPNVHAIELDCSRIRNLNGMIPVTPEAFVHLAWSGKRYELDTQLDNVQFTLEALKTAKELGCRRFLCTGSQAEYGATTLVQEESMMPEPFCAYGAAKVSVCYLSRGLARELGIEWIWGRIFSLYGTGEPDSRMLPALVGKLKKNEKVQLSSCRQNWDYLHVRDGAKAILALTERGKSGEIYNIARGDYRPLKEYVEEAGRILDSQSEVVYGSDPEPFVSLQPSVDKIFRDTGWKPGISFEEGIRAGFEVN